MQNLQQLQKIKRSQRPGDTVSAVASEQDGSSEHQFSPQFKITHMTLQVSECCPCAAWATDPHPVTAAIALSPGLHMLMLAGTLSSSGHPYTDVTYSAVHVRSLFSFALTARFD